MKKPKIKRMLQFRLYSYYCLNTKYYLLQDL
uniref:Uncharacterized protein n=1 Tax=Siphoviridae sp. ctB3v5 TaxID=2826186 RepID=A0A8S5M9G3_9CAUD|nr:MAG TPA: hypothetical protein [Siphoviridae sp. ctB3v5]